MRNEPFHKTTGGKNELEIVFLCGKRQNSEIARKDI
jgi:hypothetical protein